MNEAEKKEYKKRRKAKIATLLTIKQTIDETSKHFNVEIDQKNEVKIIVNTLFEMFANLCVLYDLDLETAIENTIAESGADTIEEFLQSVAPDEDEADSEVVINALQQLLDILKGGKENGEDE